jgi:selenocysteine lyase/cysteine desulfurase
MAYYSVMGLLGMKAAVRIFQALGVRNIQRHNYRLIDKLADYVRSNPFYTITCSMQTKHRSSIFTFTCRGYQALHRRLLKHKIIASQREGSIRVSVHLFNDDTDIDRVIAVLEEFSAGE